jgi:hypothetical protein
MSCPKQTEGGDECVTDQEKPDVKKLKVEVCDRVADSPQNVNQSLDENESVKTEPPDPSPQNDGDALVNSDVKQRICEAVPPEFIVSSNENQDTTSTMSKRQRKKLAKKLQYEANRLERRQKEREKRRLQRIAQREAARAARNAVGSENNGESDNHVGIQKPKLKKMSESACKIRVALDFAYDAEMSQVELNQTNRQAMRCYSENRRAENPLQLYFTQLSDESKKLCEKHSGEFTFFFVTIVSPNYFPITYYWTVPLILDHSYLVGKLSSSKIADTKVSKF